MPTTHTADGTPHEGGFYAGLAQSPLHLHNAVAELVDNSITAKPVDFTIHVDLSKVPDEDAFEVLVVDDAGGIPLPILLDKAFRTGHPPDAAQSHLSEHGFGLKNVLSKIQKVGGFSWWVATRTVDDVESNLFHRAETPLRFSQPIEELTGDEWPDEGSDGPGTVVYFKIPTSFASTVGTGKKGAQPSTPNTIYAYIREHLGVYYRGYLEGGKNSVGTITTALNGGDPEYVDPVTPSAKTRVLLPRKGVDTPHGKVFVEGEYGLIEKTSAETKGRHYYYRHAPDSAGVDLRIGNRVIATRLFTEIWQMVRHPSYNGLWGEFRIEATKGKIPRTLNNKTSIDLDDEIWLALAEHLRTEIEDPPSGDQEKTEAQLTEELVGQLRGHAKDPKSVTPEYPCFPGSCVEVDIVKDEQAAGGELVVYEAKTGKAHPIDVYQLRMYWDGLVANGKKPNRGILVAEGNTAGASEVMKQVNAMKDAAGNDYLLEMKEWKKHFKIARKV